MNVQPDLFSVAQAETDKVYGMAVAAAAKVERLAIAKRLAFGITPIGGTCTADDVFMAMLERGYDPYLGNAAGSLFRSLEWEFTGEWETSKRTTNHGRQNRVWRRVMTDG